MNNPFVIVDLGRKRVNCTEYGARCVFYLRDDCGGEFSTVVGHKCWESNVTQHIIRQSDYLTYLTNKLRSPT